MVRRSELPASDVTRGCVEIGVDVSYERSNMVCPPVYIQMPEGCFTNRISCWLAASVMFYCWQPSGFLGGTRLKKKKRKAVPRCPYCGSTAILRSADGIYANNPKKRCCISAGSTRFVILMYAYIQEPIFRWELWRMVS